MFFFLLLLLIIIRFVLFFLIHTNAHTQRIATVYMRKRTHVKKATKYWKTKQNKCSQSKTQDRPHRDYECVRVNLCLEWVFVPTIKRIKREICLTIPRNFPFVCLTFHWLWVNCCCRPSVHKKLQWIRETNDTRKKTMHRQHFSNNFRLLLPKRKTIHKFIIHHNYKVWSMLQLLLLLCACASIFFLRALWMSFAS